MPKPPSPQTVFVRKHPNAKPAEIVALAKKAGLPLDEAKVVKVREYDRGRARIAKQRAAKPAAPVSAGKAAKGVKRAARSAKRTRTAAVAPKVAALVAKPAAPAAKPTASPERELRRIVLELGLVRSAAILADVRARVLAALG